MAWHSMGSLRAAFFVAALGGCAALSAKETAKVAPREPAPVSPAAGRAVMGDMDRAMLQAVNTARAEARPCGSTLMSPAPPLQWDPRLAAVATEHSNDQAAHKKMSHQGSDGSQVSDRVTRAGFRWRAVGENVYHASWHASPEEAVKAWIKSAGHCRNLMQGNFTHFGSGAGDNGPQRYWTQVFASPR
jgi:uncharacterized protein YkwD